MDMNVGIVAATSATIAITGKVLFDAWRSCAFELRLLSRINSLEKDAEDLHEQIASLDAIVAQHERRFAQIDLAFRAAIEPRAPAQRPAPTPPDHRLSGAALDSVLGKESSRKPLPQQDVRARADVPVDIWVDHSKRDRHGRAIWRLYFEATAVPVVLTITIGIQPKNRPSDPRKLDVFVELVFASFEELCDLSSRSTTARSQLTTWKSVLTVECEERADEYQATSAAKSWALSVLRRERDVYEGNGTPNDYRIALQDRRYRRDELRQNSKEMELIRALLDPEAMGYLSPWFNRPRRNYSNPIQWLRKRFR